MNLAPVLKDANEKLATMGEGPITKKQMIDRWESVLCDEAKECAAVRSLSRKDYEDLVKAIAKDVQPENAPSGSVSLHPIGGSKGTTGCGWNWTKVMEGFNRQRLQEGKPRLTKQKLRNFYYTCKDAVKRNVRPPLLCPPSAEKDACNGSDTCYSFMHPHLTHSLAITC